MLLDIKDIKSEQVDEQIEIREHLIGLMVGNLYPTILRGEIEKIKELKDFITESEMEIND